MNKTPDDRRSAVAGPVDWPVRPCAWTSASWLANCTGGNFSSKRIPHQFDVPLYGKAALDAAVAAERERCAKLCEAQLDEPASGEWNMAVKCCAAAVRAEA